MELRSDCLQSLSRHENEDNDEDGVDEDRDAEDHDCTLVEKFTDVGLSDEGEAHESIFAEPSERKDGV